MKKQNIIKIIIVFVFIILSFFYLYNKNQEDKGPKTFVHSSGAFSFKYPLSLYAEEASPKSNSGIFNLANISTDKGNAEFSNVVYFDYIYDFAYHNIIPDFSTTLDINGTKVYRLYNPNPPKSSDGGDDSPVMKYIIPLNNTYALDVGIYDFEKAKAGEHFSMEQLDSIVKTLVIDKNKTIQLVTSLMNVIFDSNVKDALYILKNYAVNDNVNNLCSPIGSDPTTTEIRRMVNFYLGANSIERPIVCHSSPNSSIWAVSAPLTVGAYCIDSSGFVGNISLPLGLSEEKCK